MSIEVSGINIYLANLETRLPFEFGIVTMTEVPHCIVELRCNVNGKEVVGRSADHFPPKWLTKDPEQSLTEEAQAICKVVQQAGEHAQGVHGESVFEAWQRVYATQRDWAKGISHPPLLWAFGVTFIERALIDAYCWAEGISFGEAVRRGRFGIRLGEIYPELEGHDPARYLPEVPSTSVDVRHTVGHDAPLTEGTDRPNDGLPVSLEQNVEYYGLNKFKVKISGDVEKDVERVRSICGLLNTICGDYSITLDANEQYPSVEALHRLIRYLQADSKIPYFNDRLLFVEQPFPRDVALTTQTGEALKTWSDRPPVIIDESDGRLASCKRALDLGYAGTSHKNCKGVFKSIANACLIERRRRHEPGRDYILSAEDLTTIGPISLEQDLAVVGTLGVSHVERNGYHFFRGLDAFNDNVQRAILNSNGDLYRRHEGGFVTLSIANGAVTLDSILEAPFGYQFSGSVLEDLDGVKRVNEWNPPV